ncbi:MAG: methylenetetrahydrofolate reductase [Candidatus Melainabacteria bacterium]|nr:methylenetetrahydrofolate reductase [Candidatus Melainabacteria bacterium]
MSSTFKEKLQQQQPVLTVELSPPKGVNVEPLLRRAQVLAPWVDAINVPDCQRAILKMSSLATCQRIEQATGVETVWQLTCRDRNLIALQSDLLGGYALGLRNVLALTGDPVQVGDQNPLAKQVFHLEAVRLLGLLGKLNQDLDATGKPLKSGGPRFTVGSALNPFRLNSSAQLARLKLKMEQGIDFFQTQPVYQPAYAEQTLVAVYEVAQQLGCPPPRVLVGIIPPKSAEMARFLNQAVAGVQIPQRVIDLLERADDPVAESLKVCEEIIERLAPFVNGFHIMPVAVEGRVLPLVEAVAKHLGIQPSQHGKLPQTEDTVAVAQSL